MFKNKTLFMIITVLIFTTLTGYSSALAKEDIEQSRVRVVYEKMLSNESIVNGLEFIHRDRENTIEDQIEISEIPAPVRWLDQKERGPDYMERLIALGLEDVTRDEVGNVYGTYPGTGDGPTVVVSAHLDTVFAESVDFSVTRKGDILHGPGIGDNASGLAAMLSIIRTLKEENIQPIGDIIFLATVMEEGLVGDLGGAKHFMENNKDIDAFIGLEPGKPHRITNVFQGSIRMEISYKGPGGHGYGDFGTPNANHALGRAIAEISDIQTPADPKTTFTVGTVEGGDQSVTIAEEAKFVIDMRSTDHEELVQLVEQVEDAALKAAESENKRWNSDQLTVDINTLGNRPAGASSKLMTSSAVAATRALKLEEVFDPPKVNDTNVPASLGIHAITLRTGPVSGEHSVQEWFDTSTAFQGTQKTYLTMLSLTGVEGVTDSLLVKQREEPLPGDSDDSDDNSKTEHNGDSTKGDESESEMEDETEKEEDKLIVGGQDKSNSTFGGLLPETATPFFTYLIIGVILIMIGGTSFFIVRRNVVNMN